jgi:ACS family tartrate transporter-like MFS transporter
LIGALALGLAPFSVGSLPLAMLLLIFGRTGIKAYQPAFWTLPSLLLSPAVAAGCVGFINSFGNLGGFLGPKVLGKLAKDSGNFSSGVWFLSGMMLVSVVILLTLGLGKSEKGATPSEQKEADAAAA